MSGRYPDDYGSPPDNAELEQIAARINGWLEAID
jgi:hypothetical protein